MRRTRAVLTTLIPLLILAVGAPAQDACDQGAGTAILGAGTAGAHGVPALRSPRLPLVGGRFPKLEVSGGVPGASGVLVVGGPGEPAELPEFGGVLHPVGPLRSFPFTLDAAGAATLDLGMQRVVTPSACGQQLVVQVGVEDAAAQGGYALSAGLELRFGGPSQVALFSGWVVDDPDAAGPRRSFADFDGDGVLDMLRWGSSGITLEVRLGDGHGGFGAPYQSIPGGGALSLELVDLDHDGVLDLVHTRSSFVSPSVEILRGLGDGSFLPTASLSLGQTLFGGRVTVADLDADGEWDLVTQGGQGGRRLRAWLGDGAYGFVPVWEAELEESALALVSGDLDADGRVDVAVLQASLAEVWTLRGLGDGSFAAPETASVPDTTGWLLAADLDLDGDTELVASGHLDDTVAVLDVDETDSLSTAAVFSVPLSDRVTVHDVDADGLPDLLVPDRDTRRVSVLRGLPGGGLELVEPLLESVTGAEATLADFDLDGVDDLALGAVSMFLGEPHGGFGFRALAVGATPRSLRVADLSGDGLEDLALVARGDAAAQVVLATSPGRFADPVSLPVGELPADLEIGDLDGDGALDMVVQRDVNQNAHAVLLGAGDGSFAPAFIEHVGGQARSIALGDMDADGTLDLVAANADLGTVSIGLGAGDGSFDPAPTFAAFPQPTDVHLGDFDGDGNLDVLVSTYGLFVGPAGLTLLAGAGDGSVGPWMHNSLPLSYAIEIVNIDGDGDLDVLGVSGPSGSHLPRLGVFLNQGDGSFPLAEQFDLPGTSRALDVADLDRDGHLDVVAACSTFAPAQGVVSVRLGSGDGGFGAATDFHVGVVPNAVCATDLDDDGWLDLVVSSEGSDEVYLLFNQRAR